MLYFISYFIFLDVLGVYSSGCRRCHCFFLLDFLGVHCRSIRRHRCRHQLPFTFQPIIRYVSIIIFKNAHTLFLFCKPNNLVPSQESLKPFLRPHYCFVFLYYWVP